MSKKINCSFVKVDGLYGEVIRLLCPISLARMPIKMPGVP